VLYLIQSNITLTYCGCSDHVDALCVTFDNQEFISQSVNITFKCHVHNSCLCVNL
jgi:hypothetical protein